MVTGRGMRVDHFLAPRRKKNPIGSRGPVLSGKLRHAKQTDDARNIRKTFGAFLASWRGWWDSGGGHLFRPLQGSVGHV